MKPKTRLFLYHLSWIADKLGRPTFSNLDQGFHQWAYRNRLLRRVQALETEGLLESHHSDFDKNRFVRLTEAGRKAALGGRDPEECWNEEWPGIWHLFLFDIPEKEKALRRRFLRSLRGAGCGLLQQSAWISPRVPGEIAKLIREKGKDCSHLLTLETASKGRRMDQAMVRAAWDFNDINRGYERHLRILRTVPQESADPDEWIEWSCRELDSWTEAVENDPLLPRSLLPRGYRGVEVWEKRRRCLARVAEHALRLPPPRGDSGRA